MYPVPHLKTDFHVYIFSSTEWLHKDEELSVLYDELAVILGRLNSLDQLDQVIDNSPSEELPLNIQSSDRFQLKEVSLRIV